MGERHDAFISYSHRNEAVARQLQYELERFTKPWYRARRLRVFRDETNLTAAPDLWQAVIDAMDRSEWFILMASPEAAASEWVPREIDWWRKHRPVDRLMIGLTAGEIAWGRGDFDWDRTTALPRSVAGTFSTEPLWVDLRAVGDPPRIGDRVAEFASPMLGRPKDELIGLHVIMHRRTLRLVRSVIATLSVLVVLVGVAAVVAVRQRGAAVDQARISLARQLAATSTTLRGSDLQVAQLLAVQAYRTDANEQTRTALFGAVQESPNLVRFLPTTAEVTVLAGNGSAVVAGLADGTVLRWSLPGGEGRTLGKLASAVRAVATDARGKTVLASDGPSVLTWADDRVRVAATGEKNPVVAVGLTPSGRRGAYITSSFDHITGEVAGPDRLHVLDLSGGPVRSVTLISSYSSVALPNDAEIVLCSVGGAIERRPTAAPETLTSHTYSPLGAHGFLPTLSANGAFLTFTNGGGALPIYDTRTASGLDPVSAGWAAGHGNREQALALSDDGKVAAAVDAGTIYLSNRSDGSAPEPNAVLDGGGSVPEGGVVFLGNSNRLASASGRHVAIWDTRQVSRITRRSWARIVLSSGSAAPPMLTLSPGGRRLAVQSEPGFGDSPLQIYGVADGSTHGVEGQFLGWGTDDQHFFMLDEFDQVERVTERLASEPDRVLRELAYFENGKAPFAITPDGRRAHLLLPSGRLETLDVASRQVLATVQPVPGTSEASMPRLDRSGTKVAVLVSFGTQHVDYRVAVYDLDRHTARLVGASGTHAYSMNPNGLLIQRGSGELEWWDIAGTTMHKSIRLDRSLVTREVVLSSDPALGERLFVQRRTDGNLMLVDLVTDSVVGMLQLPNSGLNAKVSMLFPAGDRELVTVIEGDEVFEPGDHGQILRLDLDPADWIVAACASSGRNLDDAEWRRLVGTEPPEDLRCLR